MVVGVAEKPATGACANELDIKPEQTNSERRIFFIV
jgi:hypothetical protein